MAMDGPYQEKDTTIGEAKIRGMPHLFDCLNHLQQDSL